MHDSFHIFHDSRIHYFKWGSGPRLLLCFHGYGESAASFAFLEETLGHTFTILAIDLPYHGQTDWKDAPLTAETLLLIIEEIIARQPLSPPPAPAPEHPSENQNRSDHASDPQKGWWLMGYSMGGRIALSLLEKAPEKIRQLTLLAPDGLIVNPWYWLATQTAPGRQLFKWTMYHPRWFFLMLRIGNMLRLVNPSVYKFVTTYIGNRQIREELYTRWTGLRLFRPRIALIKNSIRIHQLPVQLLYGRFDRIIRAERGEQFRKGIEPWCQLTVIPAGHQLLKKDHIQTLLSDLEPPQADRLKDRH